MLRILKLFVALALLGLLALTGFAFLGDLSPEKKQMEVPVTLTPG